MSTLYALYADPASAQRAVDSLRAASSQLKYDPQQIVIVSGEPYEDYEFNDSHATTFPYRLAALGGSIGGTLGYLLTTITQHSYPIITGGMPLAPVWTNGIIVYEMTMLGAILTTLVTLLVGAGLPNFKGVITDPEISSGKILVGVVDPPEASRSELENYLRQAGASEIKQSVESSG
jgi:Protein of unknown function (DUF3341)